jgi:SAM-dependent methyltransferase
MRVGEAEFHKWFLPGGPGSGRGSDPLYTREFRQVLDRFMKEHDVKSVLDFGCGDAQFSKQVDWAGRDYLGVDIVPGAIERALKDCDGKEGMTFQIIDPVGWEPPRVDLTLCKDVLVHVPDAEAVAIARKLLLASKDVLFVQDRPSIGRNIDGIRGGYRGIDLSAPPFGLHGSILFQFERSRRFPDDKIAYWARGGEEAASLLRELPEPTATEDEKSATPTRLMGHGDPVPRSRGIPRRHGRGG